MNKKRFLVVALFYMATLRTFFVFIEASKDPAELF